MFCTKCGKKIDYEAAVCNECAGVGQWFNADTQPTPNANTEQEIKVNNDINNNEELNTLTYAIGAGIGNEFDPTESNYGKVIIMTDADDDGAHIQVLLLTFF